MLNIGDKVVCIKTFDSDRIICDQLIIGKEYEILDIHQCVYLYEDLEYFKLVGISYNQESYKFLSIPDYIKKVRLAKIKYINNVQKR